jgi:hypothetical protein
VFLFLSLLMKAADFNRNCLKLLGMKGFQYYYHYQL